MTENINHQEICGEVVKAVIYPPIGVCRVGDSDGEFFYGPEVPDPVPREPGYYRDGEGKLKRQAARFRIYGLNGQGEIVKELILGDPEVEGIWWDLHLLNQKSAWYEFQLALDIPEAKKAQPSLLRNAAVGDRSQLVIDPGKKSLSGANSSSGDCTGTFMGKNVYLGEASTDELGRLTVLGGRGVSASYNDSLAVTFANNETWHDDTSDGPVQARVRYQGVELEVDPAWVIVAPPDYAPMQKSVRTMWDLMRDVAITEGQLDRPKKPSFTAEIQPIFTRLAELQWVNAGFLAAFGWKAPFNFSDPDWLKRLADDSKANRGLRRSLYQQFRNYDVDGKSPKPWPYVYGDAMNVPAAETPRQNMELSGTQLYFLKQWAEGEFIDDYENNRTPKYNLDDYLPAEQGEALTRGAMEFCLADAFHPGCEMTWPMRHASMYASPFRLSHPENPNLPQPQYGAQLTSSSLNLQFGPLSGGQYPGAITRWMAVPWQTDTASCRSGYDKSYDPYVPTFWPARVPNQIMSMAQYDTLSDPTIDEEKKADAFAHRPSWNTPLGLKNGYTKQINTMVDHFGQMGVVELRDLEAGGAFPSKVQVADQNEIIVTDESTMLEATVSKAAPEEEEVGEYAFEEEDRAMIEKVQRFVE